MVSPSWTIERFLDELGSARPVPGGGSAAAVAGCLGTELGSMVCRILLARRNQNSKTAARLKRSLKRLDQLSGELRGLIREDAQAYLGLVRALEEKRGVTLAKRRATRSPVKICEAAAQAYREMNHLYRLAGPSLSSDLKGGQALLRGAFEVAFVTAQINLKVAR